MAATTDLIHRQRSSSRSANDPGTLWWRATSYAASVNRDQAASPGAPDAVDGVIESYELAFKMQGKVPELLDISKEPKTVLDEYGGTARPGRSPGSA